MALEAPTDEAFLSPSDGTSDDFAALDSMAFTGTQQHQSQFGMNTVGLTSSSGGGSSFGGPGSQHDGGVGMAGGAAAAVAGTGTGMGDGRDNGFPGVSGSLFDRIRARTAEQQRQQSLGVPPQQQQQEPAQSSSQQGQQGQQGAFASQGQQQQQPAGSFEPTMEMERSASQGNNAFDAAVSGVGTVAPPDNNNNETTYSFSASAGEDFSAAASQPSVPQYGASRDDPYYIASNNNAHHMPATMQDKAAVALAQTGETVKSLFSAGLSGARAVGAMAQDKMAGGGPGGGGGGPGGGMRSYNNNFLLRDDDLEQGSGGGIGSGNMEGMGGGGMGAPPPPVSAAVASGSVDAPGGYSMLKYGKTFCEDVFAFVMQLPPWGKGVVGIVLLWVLYAVFDPL